MRHPTALWIDHHQARLFAFEGEDLHREVLVSHRHRAEHEHRHDESDHAEADARFLDEVVAALGTAVRRRPSRSSTAKGGSV